MMGEGGAREREGSEGRREGVTHSAKCFIGS